VGKNYFLKLKVIIIIYFYIYFQLFKEIVPFDNMNNKSKAALFAIRASILIEYGRSLECFKNASKYAKEACELDPKTSHWFHIYSLVLTAQRQFVYTHELYSTETLLLQKNMLCPTENEINLAIQRAVSSSDGKNTYSVNLLVLTSLNELLANEFQVAQKGLPIFKADDSEYIVRFHFIFLFFKEVGYVQRLNFRKCMYSKCECLKIL